MKFLLKKGIALFAICLLASTMAIDCRESDRAHGKAQKHSGVTNITNKLIGTTGLVINKSGKYRLCETICFAPSQRNTKAITINASNVSVDLNGFELKQTNTTGRSVGIKVATGHNTIKIFNGAIRNFTQLGIEVEGGTGNLFFGNDDTILKVTGCGYGSTFAFLDNVDGQPLLQGGIQFGQTKVLAAQGYYTYLGRINTAVLKNVFVEENGPVGVYYGIGSDIITSNCSFCRNAEKRLSGNPDPLGSGAGDENTVFVFGALYNGSADSGDEDSITYEFSNCHFDENSSLGDTPLTFGLRVSYNVNGLVVRKCTFNANKGEGATNLDGFGIYGCLFAGNKGVLVEDCDADDNFSEYFTEGFHYSGRNQEFVPERLTPGEGVVYRRCSANRNIARGALSFGPDLGFVEVVGFELDFMLGVTVEDCYCLNNAAITLDPLTTAPSAQGIVLFGSTGLNAPLNNVLVSGCHVAGNTVNASNGDVEGILVQSNFSHIVIQNTVIQSNNGTGTNDVGIFTVAFNADLHNVIVQNCTIEGETVGIFSNGDNNSIYQHNTLSNVGLGVLLVDSSCNSVNNNYVVNAGVGFEDDTIPSTSLFANNRVFNAVTGYKVFYDFNGTITPVPTACGSLTTGFPQNAQVSDNVFIASPACIPDSVCTVPVLPTAMAKDAKPKLKESLARATERLSRRTKRSIPQ